MTWRLAHALVVLRDQVDELHPSRSRDSDGTKGDAAHAGRVSDHNPNGAGVVTAWDITTSDFTDALAERLRELGENHDGRVKYVIYKSRITSADHGWRWAPYTEESQGHWVDPHTNHIHLSVSTRPAEYDRTDPWPIEGTDTTEEDDMRDDERKALFEARNIAKATDTRVVAIGRAVKSLAEHVDGIPAEVVDELRDALDESTARPL